MHCSCFARDCSSMSWRRFAQCSVLQYGGGCGDDEGQLAGVQTAHTGEERVQRSLAMPRERISTEYNAFNKKSSRSSRRLVLPASTARRAVQVIHLQSRAPTVCHTHRLPIVLHMQAGPLFEERPKTLPRTTWSLHRRCSIHGSLRNAQVAQWSLFIVLRRHL